MGILIYFFIAFGYLALTSLIHYYSLPKKALFLLQAKKNVNFCIIQIFIKKLVAYLE